MGEIEKKIKKQVRLSKLQEGILFSIALGATAFSLVVPNILKIMHWSGLEKRLRQKEFSINRSLNNLIKKDLVVFVEKRGKKFLEVTDKGKVFLQKEKSKLDHINKKKRKWDKKWRIVIFDIKEHKKDLRDKVRNTLIDIGFLKLQNSVWIYPYDCEDFIKLLKVDFEIGKDVLYIVADEIENSKWILNHFNLSH